jgi:hypothetical protein
VIRAEVGAVLGLLFRADDAPTLGAAAFLIPELAGHLGSIALDRVNVG